MYVERYNVHVQFAGGGQINDWTFRQCIQIGRWDATARAIMTLQSAPPYPNRDFPLLFVNRKRLSSFIPL